jgi:hypothetical protein
LMQKTEEPAVRGSQRADAIGMAASIIDELVESSGRRVPFAKLSKSFLRSVGKACCSATNKCCAMRLGSRIVDG